MFYTNLLLVLLSLSILDSAISWGFPADGDEVLTPQLRSGLSGHALKYQSNRAASNGGTSRPNLRYQSGNRTVPGVPSARGTEQNGSEAAKEETTERVTVENSREVLETQHATCKVTTEELVATAQATVTRVLKGLCNTKEMEDRFHNLETQLADQLNVIKTMLLNIEDRITEQDQASRRAQRRIMGTVLRQCQTTAPAGMAYNSGKTSSTTLEQDEETEMTWDDEDSSSVISESPRDKEINRYNSTIHAEPILGQPYSSARSRAFTYYWRISGMDYKLKGWNHRRSLRSPSFYISPGGYRMYIRVYPRQNEENVYVHVGLTRGDFDDNLPWPFKLKHRVNILDQVSSEDGAQEDISSRVWDPTVLCSGFNWQKPTTGDNYECVGLGFPHSVIRSRDYIRDDSIVIKLTVYLD
ncbi:TNF receptor-associated factor 6 [Periplaneta americana]|uniref:TNF receptor-associated factor 6 n=1 Tax=Periplaneta americana TaxID=6978 RepID=UPI0037E9C202